MRYLTKTRRPRPKSRPHGRVDIGCPPGHTAHMSSRVLKSLAQGLIERRGELRLTQEEFAARAGMSVKTIQRIEGGNRPRAGTLAALDNAAEWPAGHARRLRDGEIFEDIPDQADDAARPRVDVSHPDEILREHFRRLWDASPDRESFYRVVAEELAKVQADQDNVTERNRANRDG